MATLAVEINTQFSIIIADESIIDMSRQREAKPDPTGPAETENFTRTAAVAAVVADEIKESLGDVDGADGGAVSIGVRMMLVQYSAIYSLKLTEPGLLYTRDLSRKLENMATARRDGLTAAQTEEPLDLGIRLDRRFRSTNYETDDTTTIT